MKYERHKHGLHTKPLLPSLRQLHELQACAMSSVLVKISGGKPVCRIIAKIVFPLFAIAFALPSSTEFL